MENIPIVCDGLFKVSRGESQKALQIKEVKTLLEL